MPPSTTGPTGCRRYSSAQTTPKLPPPPRSAQKRSGFSSAAARTIRPSAVTTCAEMRLSAEKPCLRSSQPLPLPSVSPAIPVVEIRPPVVARPNAWVARSSSAQSTPPAARTVRATGSTSISFIGARSITTPPSQTANPTTPWPPPRTASGTSRSRAYRIAAITSLADRQRAMTSGRRSIIALKTLRDSSYSG